MVAVEVEEGSWVYIIDCFGLLSESGLISGLIQKYLSTKSIV